MSDRDDIKQDAHYEKMREKNERSLSVLIRCTAIVNVRADVNATDDELLGLARDSIEVNDLDEFEFIEVWE